MLRPPTFLLKEIPGTVPAFLVGGHGSGICASYPYRDDLATANELDLIATLAVR